MSTHTLAHRSLRPGRSPNGNHGSHDGFFVSFNVKVNADRQRIFQALTLPEYMETWMALPGGNFPHALRVSSDGGSFRVDITESTGSDSSITGAYILRRRSKLYFTWKKGLSLDSPMSTVAVRLNGDFGCTELSLIHADLLSDVEYEWHRTFWQESLHRLVGLFLFSKPVYSLGRIR